jgi:enoyl-CoA hydratase/carnithine racemase
LLCDVTVASETAKLADTHVALGAVAGDGGAVKIISGSLPGASNGMHAGGRYFSLAEA